MTYVDAIALAVLAVSALAGLVRGFVREVLGLAAWVIAALGAIRLFPTLSPITRGWFSDPTTDDILAYAIGFIVLLILLSILANLAARFVQISALGGLDRLLGLLFGLGRGAVMLVITYILVGVVIPTEEWPTVVQHARGTPLVFDGAAWAAQRIPAEYRPKVVPPTAGDIQHPVSADPAPDAAATPARE